MSYRIYISVNLAVSFLIYGSYAYLLPKYRLCIFTNIIPYPISKRKLNIEKIKLHFTGKASFDTKDIVEFYKNDEPGIKLTTVNWRVYDLVKSGMVSRIGRGKFIIGKEGIPYEPEVSAKLRVIYTKLKKHFPYLNICIWDTALINEFMIHQPSKFYLLVEVEKDATESVFYFLQENKLSVFLEPSVDIISKYASGEKETVIVTSLVSEAPTQNINGVNTITLEKMLVDIFSDPVIFAAQQGSEMKIIFKEAFIKYPINRNRMLRYADRRRKKESLTNYINLIFGSK